MNMPGGVGPGGMMPGRPGIPGCAMSLPAQGNAHMPGNISSFPGSMPMPGYGSSFPGNPGIQGNMFGAPVQQTPW